MVKEYNFISVKEILSRIMRHPLLTDLTLEAAIQYTIDFIGIMGLPKLYIDKIEYVEIENFRGSLPCDLISINQIRLPESNIYLRSMASNFNWGIYNENLQSDYSYKTQGQIIYTSFKDGYIEISYKAIATDENGFPMLPDNAIFLKALELYIKKEWFTILFDMGKITPAVLQNTQQEYAFKAGQLNNEFIIPSVSEMETITNMLNQIIPNTREFESGFRSLGIREHINVH